MIRAEGLGKKYVIGQDVVRLLGKVYDNRLTRPVRRSIVRWMASDGVTRWMLNRYYCALSYKSKSLFHARYSRIFRSRSPLRVGEWKIEFLRRQIRLPLRPSLCWLDWDLALSILGHDAEIKQTYQTLLESDHPPVLFVDVGANYGTHSILFLMLGIPVMAFEPNPECYRQFQTVCRLNDVEGRWEQSALGSQTGHIELVYPERETWLGSASAKVISKLSPHSLVVRQVPVGMLDNYLSDMPEGEILLKLDVEGFEVEVLRGSCATAGGPCTKNHIRKQ